ncbi:AbiV family abortive infection protein [Xanthomonas sp. NCPPB 1067]|uniref:AbiV family abortive infection protein n=1 Tax=Xanthomonas sp. NCPPB 1067 TaxID=487524 RepID=UPI001E4002FA|nr:AbiV family abortive infection protein [Xanthomonas sp. NCPPB 1067]MCC4585739.1 AbiV family abortive infection protein [Xanthomonas sp. NCPPB 1067]
MKELSKQTLLKLSVVSIDNATALVEEAKTLLSAEHFARAYFLAVAAIEEVGKSALAFGAAGRNLADRQVLKKTWNNLLDHKSKIIAAFGPSLTLTQRENMKEALDTSLELMGSLRRGREPSMYTDVLADGSIQNPKDLVRPVAARDAVHLAQHCLARAKQCQANNEPASITAASDFFYTLSSSKIQEIMGQEDFSPFYLERINNGNISLEEAIYAFVSRPVA